MKRYKLIKTYPDSPKLGYILEQKSGSVDCENYPEFWELVVEKEFEVLSFIYNNKTLKFSENQNCFIYEPYDGYNHRQLDFLLRNSNVYKIHSVKRLSDGEIFTIGDEIDLTKYEFNFPKSDILTEIKIIDNKIRFKMNFQEKHDWNSSYTLDYIQKLKQRLFTTEDGVDVFEGDNYVIVDNKDWYIDSTGGKNLNEKDYRLYFSTKEKAEEYIVLNKPCLSFNEVYSLLGKLSTAALRQSDYQSLNTKLKQIVKNKLKIK